MSTYLYVTLALFILRALGNAMSASMNDLKPLSPRSLAFWAVVNTLMAAWAVGLLVSAGGG